MLAPSAVRLPALVFSQGLILLINSLDEIKTCTKLGFKKGFYKNLVLVDSDGNKFRVVDARKLRTLRFRLRFRDFLELLGANPRWEVELTFAPRSAQISLNDIKELVFKSFAKEKDYWTEMSDFEEFRDRISSASSLAEIFHLFNDFG